MAKAKRLAARLAEHKTVRLNKAGWLDKLPADVKAELLELRRLYQAGEYPHSRAEIYRFCREHLPALNIKLTTFTQWLGDDG